MSAAALAATAAREHRRLRRSTALQYAGLTLGTAGAIVGGALVDIPLVRWGVAGVVVTFVFVLGVLRRTARADAARSDAPALAEPSIAHYRAELVHQRDRLTGPRLWGRFVIGVPSGLAVMWGIARAYPSLVPIVRWELAAFAVAMPLAFVAGRRRARGFQTRIDELDALARGDQRAGP